MVSDSNNTDDSGDAASSENDQTSSIGKPFLLDICCGCATSWGYIASQESLKDVIAPAMVYATETSSSKIRRARNRFEELKSNVAIDGFHLEKVAFGTQEAIEGRGIPLEVINGAMCRFALGSVAPEVLPAFLQHAAECLSPGGVLHIAIHSPIETSAASVDPATLGAESPQFQHTRRDIVATAKAAGLNHLSDRDVTAAVRQDGKEQAKMTEFMFFTKAV